MNSGHFLKISILYAVLYSSNAWTLVSRCSSLLPRSTTTVFSGTNNMPPDFTVIDDEEDNDSTLIKDIEETPSEVKRSSPSKKVQGASWMQRNNDFVQGGVIGDEPVPKFSPERDWRRSPNRIQRGERGANDGAPRSFKQDFRGSRVFVQGIPQDVSWQDLKDHFRVAGEVVFASVSRDAVTGESKGHGVVQFETTEMALTAIAIMRDYPMNGSNLYVRKDAKEEDEGKTLRSNKTRENNRNNGPSWTCADQDNVSYLSDSDQTEVFSLIRARDDARRRRKYDVSDSIREELKVKFGVHLDDRLKMWWSSMDGKDVPIVIQDMNGPGRWGETKKPVWRQIPTTPENDACVNPDLVEGLLAQRDIARREKDFKTADTLLEQARTSPDGDLSLRIHDESRTWRVWTEAPPPKPVAAHLGPAERCIAIVEEHAPHKVEETQELLDRFPGREYKILKKLKQKYLGS